MTKIPLQDSKIIKEMYVKIDEINKKIVEEIESIKETIETIKEISKERSTITDKDVELAWIKLRLDYLTGVKKIPSTRFNYLKEYMNNINLEDIPSELKEYLDESN